MRWSLEAIDRELYKEEPYKRLWIMGTPSVITFKVKLGDIHEIYRNSLITEIVKYNITKDLFGFDYEEEPDDREVGDKYEAMIHINYYDPTIDGGNMLISLLAGMWNIAFWKRDSYTYQQEVRFVFTPGDENIDHIELDIGDISDITAIISAKSALSAIVEKADFSETESDLK